MIQETQLRAILDTIEGTSFNSVDSATLLMEWGFKLQQWMAFSGQQVAECKEDLHTSRKKAMINMIATLAANGAEMAVSLQKVYVDDLCAKENMLYELAGRCNSSCIHALDFVRSCLSTLKTEMQLANATEINFPRGDS